MTERVMVGNAYVGNQRPNAVVQWLLDQRVFAFIVSEIGKLQDDLARHGAVFNAPEDRPADTGLWFSKRRRGYRVRYLKMTDFIHRGQPSPMLWRDRWIVRVQLRSRVWYSVHANAAIAGPEGRYADNKGADAWKEALARLRRMVREDKKKGLNVKIGGDFNCRPNPSEPLNPAQLFDSLDMRYISTDVMYLAWDPEYEKLEDRMIIKSGVPGADGHGALWAKFSKRNRARNAIRRLTQQFS